jgi:hypothetical protein
MAGVFACPECGQELAVEGFSPGREILCDGCSTWVEVPYLPRAGGSRPARRGSPRSAWDSPLLKGAILFAVVAMGGLFATKLIGGRVRSSQEKVLTELVASAQEAETAHHYDVASREIESALAQARLMGLEHSPRLEELEEHRDRIAIREVEFRLANLDSLDIDQAVGEALTLSEKAGKNPALDSLVTSIEAKLAALRLLQANRDLATARQALDQGREADAFTAAARLHDRAGDLSRTDASRFAGEARTILETAVGRKGVALPAVVGRFVAGSADTYTKILDRPRAEILRVRGFLPQPRTSPWASLWEEKAPFHATVEVIETQEQFYLQSKNRTTQVDGTFELYRGDRLVWKNRIIARTREPLPDLPAILGGHLGTADKRNPETERRLHDDAMKQFVDLANRNFRAIPTREAALKVP